MMILSKGLSRSEKQYNSTLRAQKGQPGWKKVYDSVKEKFDHRRKQDPVFNESFGICFDKNMNRWKGKKGSSIWMHMALSAYDGDITDCEFGEVSDASPFGWRRFRVKRSIFLDTVKAFHHEADGEHQLETIRAFFREKMKCRPKNWTNGFEGHECFIFAQPRSKKTHSPQACLASIPTIVATFADDAMEQAHDEQTSSSYLLDQMLSNPRDLSNLVSNVACVVPFLKLSDYCSEDSPQSSANQVSQGRVVLECAAPVAKATTDGLVPTLEVLEAVQQLLEGLLELNKDNMNLVALWDILGTDDEMRVNHFLVAEDTKILSSIVSMEGLDSPDTVKNPEGLPGVEETDGSENRALHLAALHAEADALMALPPGWEVTAADKGGGA